MQELKKTGDVLPPPQKKRELRILARRFGYMAERMCPCVTQNLPTHLHWKRAGKSQVYSQVKPGPELPEPPSRHNPGTRNG